VDRVAPPGWLYVDHHHDLAVDGKEGGMPARPVMANERCHLLVEIYRIQRSNPLDDAGLGADDEEGVPVHMPCGVIRHPVREAKNRARDVDPSALAGVPV